MGMRSSSRPAAIAAMAVLLGAAVGISAAFLTARDRPERQAGAASTTVRDAPREGFYTVILASFPAAEDPARARAQADRRVGELRGRGVDASVLDSSQYRSLEPDFMVVHSGRFRDEQAAQTRQQELKADGVTDGYVKQATP